MSLAISLSVYHLYLHLKAAIFKPRKLTSRTTFVLKSCDWTSRITFVFKSHDFPAAAEMDFTYYFRT